MKTTKQSKPIKIPPELYNNIPEDFGVEAFMKKWKYKNAIRHYQRELNKIK